MKIFKTANSGSGVRISMPPTNAYSQLRREEVFSIDMQRIREVGVFMWNIVEYRRFRTEPGTICVESGGFGCLFLGLRAWFLASSSKAGNFKWRLRRINANALLNSRLGFLPCLNAPLSYF
jgi:hypothetical protein